MKLSEITNQARKTIKQMESMYITYITTKDPQLQVERWDITKKLIDSTDADITREAKMYSDQLGTFFVDVLTGNDA